MSKWNCLICKELKEGIACTFCDYGSKFVRMTNADAIRNMTDEEFAEVLRKPCVERASEEMCDAQQSCRSCLLEWLQAEVGDVNE